MKKSQTFKILSLLSRSKRGYNDYFERALYTSPEKGQIKANLRVFRSDTNRATEWVFNINKIPLKVQLKPVMATLFRTIRTLKEIKIRRNECI